ncbi:hypothetical protein DVG78_00275 [Runella aurantiaca]|uniref:Uncharacterized protein n=1 Tax=Runella aurantiaca TaxID=2282308 RepID=A0A369IFB5_9BACT|nr:hypothetical protein DVG78_00275 [Runella aurantiaca]
MIELFLYTTKVLPGSLKNDTEFFRCFTKFQGFVPAPMVDYVEITFLIEYVFQKKICINRP